MASRLDPLNRAYEPNTSRIRDTGLLAIEKRTEKRYDIEEWMLSAWIRVWVFLLIGIILFPIAIVEVFKLRTGKGVLGFTKGKGEGNEKGKNHRINHERIDVYSHQQQRAI